MLKSKRERIEKKILEWVGKRRTKSQQTHCLKLAFRQEIGKECFTWNWLFLFDNKTKANKSKSTSTAESDEKNTPRKLPWFNNDEKKNWIETEQKLLKYGKNLESANENVVQLEFKKFVKKKKR